MDNIQALISEASECLGCGNLKSSYGLYIKALDAAVHELYQIQFINQYAFTLPDHFPSVFLNAKICLQQAQDITTNAIPKPSMIWSTQHTQQPSTGGRSVRARRMSRAMDEKIQVDAHVPPPVPPKPKFISKPTPPPLPARKPTIPAKPFDVVDVDDDDDDDDDLSKGSNRVPQRRQSMSNITSPLNSGSTVKTLLSLPSSVAWNAQEVHKRSESTCQDQLVLMATGMVNPNCLTKAQTSIGDTLALPTCASTAENIPSIPQAPLLIIYKSLQEKLSDLERRSRTQPQTDYTLSISQVKSSLNRVRNIHMSATTIPTILQFSPIITAYQLTLMDSAIYRNIPPNALLEHTAKTPHPAIVASTDFFNYLTRIIEHSILLQQDASGRAQHIHYWVKAAAKCHDLLNFQTLKAIICALGTPPIQRLKRSWAFVPKKSITRFEALCDLMSETANYERYRSRLERLVGRTVLPSSDKPSAAAAGSTASSAFLEPIVPFLGTFLHDATYLAAAIQKHTGMPLYGCRDDPRVADFLSLFVALQKHPPYASTPNPAHVKDLKRRRILSYALMGSSPIKKHWTTEDEPEDLSVEMQQCLVTQYLLTRSWVSEKTVDGLSVLREPPKLVRNVSPAVDTLSSPSLGSLVSLSHELRSSSGTWSMVSGGSSSSIYTHSSFEDATLSGVSTSSLPIVPPLPADVTKDRGFWLFGRKSIDHNALKASGGDGKPRQHHRLSRHFSFEDLHVCKQLPTSSSLATSIFRRDFWRQSTSIPSSGRSSMEEPLPHPRLHQRRRSSSTSSLTLRNYHYHHDSDTDDLYPETLLAMATHPLDQSGPPPPPKNKAHRQQDVGAAPSKTMYHPPRARG